MNNKTKDFIGAWTWNINEEDEACRLIQKLRNFRMFVGFKKYRRVNK